MAEVKLPELAAGVTKAIISFWHFNEGEQVNKGDDLVEMLTDKATFNVPAPFAGKVKNIKAQEGQEVNVGDTIAIIE